MDLTTIAGVIGFIALITGGIVTDQLTVSLVNVHGVYVVFGGCLVAILINTPLKNLIRALKELGSLFKGNGSSKPETMIPIIVELAEQCRMKGLSALRETDTQIADGFLNRAAFAALEYNDTQFVRQVLEQEINQVTDEINEAANVYRTMGVLAPMFGLLGTLIGIVWVLKDLANPENVGPAMAVAITSAFYGIFFANMVCVPIAGKINSRVWMDVKVKSMILEGILEIMKGSIPMVVERRLQSYIS